MSVDIVATSGNVGGMTKLGGGDISSLINALNNLAEDQMYRADLIIDVDGGKRIFHCAFMDLFATSIISISNSTVQYFFDKNIEPNLYKRVTTNGTSTDTAYTLNEWILLYAEDGLGSNTYPANKVSYDNTYSHLNADNVQDAIDECAGVIVVDGTLSDDTGDYLIYNALPAKCQVIAAFFLTAYYQWRPLTVGQGTSNGQNTTTLIIQNATANMANRPYRVLVTLLK